MVIITGCVNATDEGNDGLSISGRVVLMDGGTPCSHTEWLDADGCFTLGVWDLSVGLHNLSVKYKSDTANNFGLSQSAVFVQNVTRGKCLCFIACGRTCWSVAYSAS